MAKRFRFRPLGWFAAIGTLGAMAGVMIVAAPGSAAGTERPIEKTFEAECVLAPGTLNLKGTIHLTQKGTLPETVSPGEEITAKGNTLTIETPESWGCIVREPWGKDGPWEDHLDDPRRLRR